MFCNKCGAQLLENAKFCNTCGAPQSQPVNQAPVAPVQQPVAPQPTYQQPVYQQPVAPQPTYQQPVYQQPAAPQPTYQQPTYQQPVYQQPAYQQPGYNTGVHQQTLPMNWFKFLIYVALFLAALSCISTAVSYMTGSVYDSYTTAAIEAADMDVDVDVYDYIPDLEDADITYGILNIVLAVAAIVIRFRLAGYHKDGPKLLLAYYGASTAISVIYAIWASAAIKDSIAYDAAEYYAEEMVQVFTGAMTISVVMSVIISAVMITANAIYFKKREHLFH